MNKKLRLIGVAVIVAANLMVSGCSIPFFGGKEKKAEEKKVETPVTSIEEDSKVKALMDSYFKALFKEPVEKYSENSLKGIVPNSIKSMVSARTLAEGDKNPEIGIHLPRMVEINGINMTSYEILNNKDGAAKIDATFIGKNGDSFLYFVKLDLKAKGLYQKEFDKYYVIDDATKLYKRKVENGQPVAIKETDYDFIKVQAQYDVEVLKEDDGYKVTTQREANFKPGLENRQLKLNNDFMARLPYLDVEIADEKNIYENEKKLIESLFTNLTMLDKERMILLRSNWDKGQKEFSDFINKTKVGKVSDKDVLLIEKDYKNKFDYESLPLKINMLRINEVKNIVASIHPGYSQKYKRYLVTFDAGVITTSGMVEDQVIYKYDYDVTLKEVDGVLKIQGIKLNQYLRMPSQKPKDASTGTEAGTNPGTNAQPKETSKPGTF